MPNLIVLPLVLVEQWKEQFKRTTGHSPLVYYGAVKKMATTEMLENSANCIDDIRYNDFRQQKRKEASRSSMEACDIR